MKIIYKIHKYYPDTNQISVSFCNLKSREPIDNYKSYGVNCDDLDMFDVQSFSESLIVKSGQRRIETQDEKLETLEQNIPQNINGIFDIRDLVGKVICAKGFDKKIKRLPMRRVNL